MRKSMSYTNCTGDVPESWEFSQTLTDLANKALYFCRTRNKAHQSVKVYMAQKSAAGYLGRAYTTAGLIRLNKGCVIQHTLAHEVAHFAYSKHGKRHAMLTEKIEKFFTAIWPKEA